MVAYDLATNLIVLVRALDPSDVFSPVVYSEVSPAVSMRGFSALDVQATVTQFFDSIGAGISLGIWLQGSHELERWDHIPESEGISGPLMTLTGPGTQAKGVTGIGWPYVRVWYHIDSEFDEFPPSVGDYFIVDCSVNTQKPGLELAHVV